MTNNPLNGSESREFAEAILTANGPEEVSEQIDELDSIYGIDWKPLGENQNNYSTVHNQAASPMAALVELPINSADAQMFKFYEDNAPDSVDPMEYTSMKEAVEADWVDIDEAEIEILADGLKPTEGNRLNLIIRDNGKGKSRNNFDDFVGLSDPGLKKQKYGFCQGQYGMGSTGVLKYCGDTEAEFNELCFKFIASASTDKPGEWSWTVIRDNPHEGQFEHLTIDGDFPIFDGTFGGALARKFREQYTKYDFDKNVTPPPEQEYGSFVKIYDYDTISTRTNISGYTGFRRKFERFLVDSPFPIRLTEMRYTKNKAPHSTTRGFLPTLRDGREHLLKDEEHILIETNSETLEDRDAHVLLFKSDSELEDVDTTDRGKKTFVAGATKSKDAPEATGIQKDHAVMLTVNGQTHGSKSQFFLEQLGYSKTAEDTVVIVEFDDLANLGMVKMFKPSRDDLTDSPQTRKFISGLKSGLKNSDLLTEEEERRRAYRGSESKDIDVDTFEKFINRHPDIANYINFGDRISASYLRPDGNEADSSVESQTENPVIARGNGEVVGGGSDTGWGSGDDTAPPMLPTYLHPIEEYDPDGDYKLWDASESTMPVKLPVDGQAKIRFETDAQRDYLSRDILGGEFLIEPRVLFSSVEIRDGILTLTITSEEQAAVGDERTLFTELTRPDPSKSQFVDDPNSVYPESGLETDGGSINAEPLTAGFSVQYIEPTGDSVSSQHGSVPEEEEKNGAGDDLDTDGSENEKGEISGGDRSEGLLDWPNIDKVYEEEWLVDENGNPEYPEEYRPEIGSDFNANTVIRVEPSKDGSISGLFLKINMDAAPLRRFIIDENIKDNWKEYVEGQYELAVVFYTISQYRELYEAYGESLDESRTLTTDIVENSINGIGQLLMPTIIPEEHLDDISD